MQSLGLRADVRAIILVTEYVLALLIPSVLFVLINECAFVIFFSERCFALAHRRQPKTVTRRLPFPSYSDRYEVVRNRLHLPGWQNDISMALDCQCRCSQDRLPSYRHRCLSAVVDCAGSTA